MSTLRIRRDQRTDANSTTNRLTIPVYASTGSAGTPSLGAIIYTTTDSTVYKGDGNQWAPLGAGGGGGLTFDPSDPVYHGTDTANGQTGTVKIGPYVETNNLPGQITIGAYNADVGPIDLTRSFNYSANSVQVGLANYTAAGLQGAMVFGAQNLVGTTGPTGSGTPSLTVGLSNTNSSSGSIVIGGGNIGISESSTIFGVSNNDAAGDSTTHLLVGISNQIADSPQSMLIGLTNAVTGSSGSAAIGNNNVISASPSSTVTGIQSQISNSYGSAAIGSGVIITDSYVSTAMGVTNQILGSTGGTIFGLSCLMLNSSASTICGAGSSIQNSSFSYSSGVINTIVGGDEVGLDTCVGVLNTMENVTLSTVVGAYNSLVGPGAGATSIGHTVVGGLNLVDSASFFSMTVGHGNRITMTSPGVTGTAMAMGYECFVDDAPNSICIGSRCVSTVAKGIAIGTPQDLSDVNDVVLASESGPTSAAIAIGTPASGIVASVATPSTHGLEVMINNTKYLILLTTV